MLSELKTVLRNQKYPNKIIEAGIKKASIIIFETLCTEKDVPKIPILSFASTFNPDNSKFFPTIKSNMKNLRKSKTMKDVLKDYKLIRS